MTMDLKVWHVILLLVHISTLVSCQKADEASKEIHECLQHMGNGTDTEKLPSSVHSLCLRQFIWKAEKVQWADYNITKKDMEYINSLVDSIIRKTAIDARTYIPGGYFPRTGFRVRREIRRLSDKERKAYFKVINKLKEEGQYDRFANLHRGKVIDLAHGGPNFFGWHRIFLALVEEAMRQIDPTIAIPYWDSTMDAEMENPKKSIMWSPEFLGNGIGKVVTGVFANWDTPFGKLKRSLGKIDGGRLITKEDIALVLKQCKTRDMSHPTAKDDNNLDVIHGYPHKWVGGQMFDLNSVVHDPAFYLHHSFVDYMWELFRKHQANDCNVNPATDYPNLIPEQAPDITMIGLTQYNNIDGYSTVWTKYWYKFEPSPTCSKLVPSCGSKYLRCDTKKGRCVSVEAPESTDKTEISNTKISEQNVQEILAQDEWFG